MLSRIGMALLDGCIKHCSFSIIVPTVAGSSWFAAEVSAASVTGQLE